MRRGQQGMWNTINWPLRMRFVEWLRLEILMRGSVVDLQALVDETAQKVTRNASQHDGDASIGTAGLRGEGEFRWSSRGPRARENMELWLKHLMSFDSEPTPLRLEWGEEGLRIIHPPTSEDTDAETMATGCELSLIHI